MHDRWNEGETAIDKMTQAAATAASGRGTAFRGLVPEMFQEVIVVLQGGCHCGRIAFEVEGEATEAMTCNCSYCGPQGYMLAFFPRDALALKTPESNLSNYLFNKNVISHYFCATCGVSPFGEGDGPNGKMAAVNLRCVSGIDLKSLKITEYDGASAP